MAGSEGDKTELEVRVFAPAAALRPEIDAYYTVTAHGAVRDLTLASGGNIRFALAGEWRQTRDGVHVPTPWFSGIFGPVDRAFEFGSSGPAVMLGIGLTPQGWARLVGAPASELANRVVSLADHVGLQATCAIETALAGAGDEAGIVAALDAWLGLLVAAAPPADPRIAVVHRALLDGPADVAAFAGAAGMSERTLQRLCDAAFGFGPKALLRQKRFLRTLERVRGVLDRPLSDLIDDGYVDQAHFNRDFRHFMGMTPTAYFNSPREIMRRAAVARRAVNGKGLQGLHPAPA